MEKQLNIPDYWEQISLVDDFIYVPTGVENYEGKKPYYSTGSIKTHANTVEGEYSSIDRPSRANRIAKKGDVLQARMKDTNKALIIDQGLDGALFSTGFFQVRPYTNTYSSKLLYYYLFSNSFLNEKNDLCSGSTQSALNDMQAKKLYVPLPPLAEQHRIVDKIESLFSELDNSIKNLTAAKEQLIRYRQSVLKSAFEGKLTAAWREANGDKLETAVMLMERIKAERGAAYASNSRKPKELSLLSADEIADLPELPKGWGWIKLNELSEIITDGDHQAPPKADFGIPFIVISNIKNNKIDFADSKFVPNEYYENLQEYRKVRQGDILYTVTGSYGIPVLINFDKKFVFQRHIGLVRLFEMIDKQYIYHLLSSQFIFNQATNIATGTAQKTVPLSGIREFKIPLASSLEQHQIVNEIESRFSQADVMERTINESLIKAEKMRQTILKKAFEGKLVDQNPDDESALELLKQIQEEKIKYQIELKNQKKNKVNKVKKVSIVETLQKVENNTMKSKELWQQSQYHDDIEGFYAALKKEIEEYQTVEEYKNNENDQSYVRLRNADR